MLERERGSAPACGCGEAREHRTNHVWAAAACGCGGGKHPLLARGRMETGVGRFTSLRSGTGARARRPWRVQRMWRGEAKQGSERDEQGQDPDGSRQRFSESFIDSPEQRGHDDGMDLVVTPVT